MSSNYYYLFFPNLILVNSIPLFFELFFEIFYINYLWYYFHFFSISPITIEVFIKSTNKHLYVKALQDIIHINPFVEESTLLFFRFHNNSSTNLLLLTTYSIIPYEIYLYFIKLQCFCFDKIQIKPYQTIDLPILFCMSKDYMHLTVNHIVLIYNVFSLT